MPTVDNSIGTYLQRKRGRLITTLNLYNPVNTKDGFKGGKYQDVSDYLIVKHYMLDGSSQDSTSPSTCSIVLADIASLDGTTYTLNSNKSITECQTLTIPVGVTFTIPPGITLTNNGTIINYGLIECNGILITTNIISNSSVINMYGDLTNSGTITNIHEIFLYGTFLNNNLFINTGPGATMIINPIATLTNNGTVNNIEAGSISVDGTFINEGTFNNLEPSEFIDGGGTYSDDGTTNTWETPWW
jgi:hypothetical protein